MALLACRTAVTTPLMSTSFAPGLEWGESGRRWGCHNEKPRAYIAEKEKVVVLQGCSNGTREGEERVEEKEAQYEGQPKSEITNSGSLETICLL